MDPISDILRISENIDQKLNSLEELSSEDKKKMVALVAEIGVELGMLQELLQLSEAQLNLFIGIIDRAANTIGELTEGSQHGIA